MKNRINLDDPNYNQQVVIQDNKAKIVWIILSIIAVIFGSIIILTSQNHNQSKVKHGTYFDFYDDDGDGWVDRIYSREFKTWGKYTFEPGVLSMDDAE